MVSLMEVKEDEEVPALQVEYGGRRFPLNWDRPAGGVVLRAERKRGGDHGDRERERTSGRANHQESSG